MILSYQKIELLDKTIFERVIFSPPLKATESMKNEACLIYAVNGHSKFYGSDQNISLGTGESLLMKCGNFVNHWQKMEGSEEENEAVAIHFYPKIIEFVFRDQLPEYLKRPPRELGFVARKIDPNKILKSYIGSLIMYFENPELFDQDAIRLKLKELIGLLYNLNINGIRELLADMFTPERIEFKEVISKHLFHDLSLEDYALLTHTSLSTFKRKFKDIYRESPARYIKNKRLEFAAELLTNTEYRITDVCFDSGFTDLSNFSKSFQKKFGISPKEYKQNHMLS